MFYCVFVNGKGGWIELQLPVLCLSCADLDFVAVRAVNSFSQKGLVEEVVSMTTHGAGDYFISS